MGTEAAVGPWDTWEELILGGAVLRHGTRAWNDVASELRARSLRPYSFTPQACKAKYEDLLKRYSGTKSWFEELRKRRVEELKQELARSEDSIGSLELEIKSLKAENRSHTSRDGQNSSKTESPVHALNSDGGMESSGKDITKDESSAGSFTKDTRTTVNWLCNHPKKNTDMEPDVSGSSEHLSILKLEEPSCRQGQTIKKRRGPRKRKDCNPVAKEGSMGESENISSSNIESIANCDRAVKDSCTNDHIHISEMGYDMMEIFQSIEQSEPASLFRHRLDCNQAAKEGSMGESDDIGSSNNTSFANCDQTVKDYCTNNHNDIPEKGHDVMEMFESIEQSEPASLFRHRLDGQKRARYRKLIMQHVDMGTIRSRIMERSIMTSKELFRDLLLLANNALVFYSRRTKEHKLALMFRHLVSQEYNKHYRGGSCYEATTPFNPPVKPRSARPQPRPRPEKLSNVDKAVTGNNKNGEGALEDSDDCVLLCSLLKAKKKGAKRRPVNVSTELLL